MFCFFVGVCVCFFVVVLFCFGVFCCCFFGGKDFCNGEGREIGFFSKLMNLVTLLL